jgi:predicted nucleotidyltransferase
MTPSEIAQRALLRCGGGDGVLEDGCGICARLCNSARMAKDLDTFIGGAYNAKYTNARINRVALFSALGVSDAIDSSLPEYTTLLAASDIGRAWLSSIRKSCGFNIVTKPADAPDGVQSRISRAADEFYAHAMLGGDKTDYFVKCKPYMTGK